MPAGQSPAGPRRRMRPAVENAAQPRPMLRARPVTELSASTQRWRNFGLAVAGLGIAFIKPLARLLHFAIQSDLYSSIVLVPFISAWLVRLAWKSLPHPGPDRQALAILPFAGGICSLAVLALWPVAMADAGSVDRLALSSFAFVLLLCAAALFFLGATLVRAMAFPLAFLAFLIPLPAWMELHIDSILQYGSAAVALALFRLTGTPVLNQDLVFRLPGISLQVAPECSGIHSSLVLFMTSLLAGHLFLRSPWRKTLLAVAVFPLALLRNGFRVFVIGELCVHISPDMINSFIHRRGGPVFFALSLVPFFALLLILVKGDRRPEGIASPPG